MKLPENVNYIFQILERSGYLVYVVGGCVRDEIMGSVPKDWDIATSATPNEIKALFPHTYDTGLKHGTVTVIINSLKYEVTTFRIDGKYEDGRRPASVTFSSNLNDDLERRDFTINAIAYNAKVGFVDPFGGISDIKNKIIRGVGNADERIKEDALRMLRAVRFGAVLGFELENKTKNAVIDNAPLIEKISAERIREELFLVITAQNTSVIFTDEFLILMDIIYSPLADSLRKNKEMLIKQFAACKNDIVLRLAVLIYFLSGTEADCFLKRLKLSNKMYHAVFHLHHVQNYEMESTYYTVASAISRWGFSCFENYLYMQMLNCIAADGDLSYAKHLEEHYNLIVDNNLPVFIKDLAINGYDLNKEFKITGAAIGATLNGLLDYIHENPYNNNFESLLKEAYRIITGF